LHSEDIALRIQSAQKSARPFPLTFRLMDAPLDEFLLPDQKDAVIARVGQANIRGVQFANQTSGLYEMQIHALRDAINKTDYSEPVRIMIPNVQTAEEVAKTKAMVFDLMDGKEFEFGVMIETLDAIENIRPIAQQCDFMSFGTNDLTAEVMGNVNRVDYDAISKWMMDNDVQGETPFKQLIPQVLDQMQIATDGARDVNPDIHISACGHQLAIDPKAPKIALSMGFNAVSVPNMKFYAMRLMSAYHANICTMPTTKVAVVVDNSSSPDSLTL
jgi:phosphoenolpyruvate-protein kinase (PTS system EI component)